MDRAIMAAALAFIAILAALTLAVAIEHGPDILTIGSLLVLGMFGFGIVGALRNPPE
jgi:hypothetical protein